MWAVVGAAKTIAKLEGQENLSRSENKSLKEARKKVAKSNTFLAKLKPDGEEALYQERVIEALRTSRDLPAEMGGGSTAMVLCQRQLHQSSSAMELGLGLSYRREGRLVMALGICPEGEHVGKVQLTILSQSKMVITNLDGEENRLNSARVTALMARALDAHMVAAKQ